MFIETTSLNTFFHKSSLVGFVEYVLIKSEIKGESCTTMKLFHV